MFIRKYPLIVPIIKDETKVFFVRTDHSVNVPFLVLNFFWHIGQYIFFFVIIRQINFNGYINFI